MARRNVPLVLRDIAVELHRPARKNYLRRDTTVKGFKDLFQADLVEMIPYANVNKNFRYLLTVIDVFSKYAWARAIKNKEAATLVRAMRDILNSSDGQLFKPPALLQTDKGREFDNVKFRAMLDEYNIKLFSTYSIKKAAVVERFNRTLKTKMWREFSARGSYKWIHILDDLMREYNNSKHRAIGMMKPNEITAKDESFLREIHDKDHISRSRGVVRFKVGNYVRISRLKGKFEKGYTPNWSTELFVIRKVQPTCPVTYLLKDIKGNLIEGGFYNEELQKTSLKDTYLVDKIVKRRGNRVLVKWYGFPSSENTWEDEKNIVI